MTANSPRQVAEELLQALLARGSADSRQKGQRFFKEPVDLVGVDAKTMRQVARASVATVRRLWTLDNALAVVSRLLPDPRLEVKISSLLFLSGFGKRVTEEVFEPATEWLERGWCSSWSVVDTLCLEVLGPVLLRETEHVALVMPWANSRTAWSRRAALAAPIKLARKGLELDQIYALVLKLGKDPEDLVQKAAGWLLREASKSDPKRLEKFLREHGQNLARIALRAAIERFPDKKRRELLATTRPD